jgi:hypothetical protein
VKFAAGILLALKAFVSPVSNGGPIDIIYPIEKKSSEKRILRIYTITKWGRS